MEHKIKMLDYAKQLDDSVRIEDIRMNSSGKNHTQFTAPLKIGVLDICFGKDSNDSWFDFKTVGGRIHIFGDLVDWKVPLTINLSK